MSAAPVGPAPQPDAARRAAETDLWWGSYAGRTMTLSFTVCGLLTLLIYVGVRIWVRERGWLQLAFAGFASAVWLVQLTRWCHRFFTYNYRLTTRFLYVDRGFLPIVAQRLPLEAIDCVQVRSSKLGELLGVGDIWVLPRDPAEPPAVLEGVLAARRPAELIRDAVRKAREINP